MQTHISHEITGELLGHLHFLPGVGTDGTRVMTTGDGRLVAHDTLANLLHGVSELLDTLTEEVDHDVDMTFAMAAEVEITHTPSREYHGGPEAPMPARVCEDFIDRSAIRSGLEHQSTADLFRLAASPYLDISSGATHELIHRGTTAAQILAHVQAHIAMSEEAKA